jgi:hypothetical protein
MIVKAAQKDDYSSKSGNGDIIYKYIEDITTMSKSTAYEYHTRLNIFKAFVSKEFHDLSNVVVLPKYLVILSSSILY